MINNDALVRDLDSDRRREAPFYSNIDVIYNGRTFKLHKSVLGKGSEFFRAFFSNSRWLTQANPVKFELNGPFASSRSSNTKEEKIRNRICIEYEISIFEKCILAWLYRSNPVNVIDEDNVYYVFAFADYLMIKDLADECKMHMSERHRISANNCPKILYYGLLYSLKDQVREATSWISENCQQHFTAFYKADFFRAFDCDIVGMLLDHIFDNQVDELTAEDRLDAVTSWVEYKAASSHEIEQREKQVHHLMKKVNLSDIPSEQIESKVLEKKSLASSPEILAKVSKIFLHRIGVLEREKEETAHRGPIVEAHGYGKIWMIGGGSQPTRYAEFDLLNRTFRGFRGNTLRTRGSVDHNQCILARKIGGCIYVVLDKLVQQISLHHLQQQPRVICETLVERDGFAGDTSDGILYIVGGDKLDEKRSGTTIEYFNERLARVTSIVHQVVPDILSNLAVVALHGYLYLIGGERRDEKDGEITSGRVYSFNPSKQTVLALASMSTPRSQLAAVTVNDYIIAIGGKDSGGRALTSVEYYCTRTGKWGDLEDMNHPRIGCCACVLEGKVYVIGGQGSAREDQNTIEMYDPVYNRWQVIYTMMVPRRKSACVAL